jgi:phospholipase A1
VPPPPPPDAAAQAPAPAPPSGPAVVATPAGPAFYDLLTFYKDNYFITGFSNSVEAKFQFSAKFDLWPNRGRNAVYFAYSQKSLWNIYQSSAPFQESNYNPEIFYTFFHHEGRYLPPPGCAFFHERAGAEHESNGLAGATSRGWNRIYIESRYSCHAAKGLFASATLKVWAPPIFDSDNPDIVNYLGYGELSLEAGGDRGDGWLDQWDITVTGRKGTSASIAVGSVQIDARWRPPTGTAWRFTPFLYGQMFTGYGETLLSYDRPLTAFRVGIGLSDISTRSR